MIEKQIQEEKVKKEKETHFLLLLLGPGDSGKSTVLKQITLLHGPGFSDAEREKFKFRIHFNIIKNMKILLAGRSLHANAQTILGHHMDDDDLIPDDIFPVLEMLWNSPFIKKDFKVNTQLDDCTA